MTPEELELLLEELEEDDELELELEELEEDDELELLLDEVEPPFELLLLSQPHNRMLISINGKILFFIYPYSLYVLT